LTLLAQIFYVSDEAGNTMKIILDTNVYLSAILFGSVKLEQMILFCFENFEIAVCDELFAEIDQKTDQETQLSKTERELITKIKEYGSCYQIQRKTEFERDPKDAYLLDLAVTSSASFLITGDKDLLNLRFYQQTKILNPREFIDLVKST
jgi:hypothetical protein